MLKSSAHFGGAKFTRMMSDLTNEEKIELFNDDILKRLERVTDYESMSSVFRAVPALYTKWLDEGKDKESFEKTRLGYYNAIFCGEDWYVIYSYYGLQYECLDDDPRAKKEMEVTISVINEHIRNKNDIRKLVLAYNNKKG